MIHYKDRDYVMEITKAWKGERFADGRPRVPDNILERIRKIRLEEAWKYLYDRGYQFQFEGELRRTQEYKLVGRAATFRMVPTRPDLAKATDESLAEENKFGMFRWTIDELQEGDVLVADCYDKVKDCTYLGGNLTTAIKARTKNGGAVIYGGIRDLEQVQSIDIQIYYRQTDPGWMRDGLICDAYRPVTIGRATCMPGDVVFGTVSGVLFIPPHMAEPLVTHAEKEKVKDIFGFAMLESGTYTAEDIDTAVWKLSLMERFLEWFRKAPETQEYQYLDWSEELERSKGL
ncbi:MAG: RraA family protein [Lachnospiraceae bacterium]|nr:RraA family protein [Lachnospiraceae bacterium]